jgi:hypothetical protein
MLVFAAETSQGATLVKDAAASASTQPLPPLEIALLAIAFVVIMLLAVRIGATPLPARDPEADPREAFFRSSGWRFVHAAVLGLLGLAAVWSALPSGPNTLTGAFLTAVVVIALIPIVEKITFPWGGAIDVVKREIQNDAETLRQEGVAYQLVLAQATQIIAELQTLLLDGRLRYAGSDARMADLSNRVFATAFPIIASILVPPPAKNADGTTSASEAIRISVFNKTTDPQILSCTYAWPTSEELKDLPLLLEDDRPSEVYRTGISVNLPDLVSEERPPKGTTEFKGIAIVPIVAASGVSGILIVERARCERFGATEMAMARALASLTSSAVAS